MFTTINLNSGMALTIDIPEGTLAWTKIGQVDFVPTDGREVEFFVVWIVGGDFESLYVNQTTGEIFYIGGGSDYKTAKGLKSFQLDCSYFVQFTDGSYQEEDISFTAQITEVDETPVLDLNSGGPFSVEIPEGTPAFTKIAQFDFVPTDGREVEFFTVWIVGGAFENFFIDEYTGELFYIGPVLDYENPPDPKELKFEMSLYVEFTDGTHFGESIDTSDKISEIDEPTTTELVVKGTRGDDVLVGSANDDVLRGKRGDDKLDGGAGDDLLKGGKGHDTLFGGAGDDRLEGGKGRDTLLGGIGTDVLKGGKGRDLFVVDVTDNQSLDMIVDFERGKDTTTVRHHEGVVFWQRWDDDVRLSTSSNDKAFLVLEGQDAVFDGDFTDSQINLVEIV
ncbi:MAG: Leukotoxin [Alphaproteobacteria bacterium]|nr:MAG: Leukotoxin [Alphaproteobacteria bacterium]